METMTLEEAKRQGIVKIGDFIDYKPIPESLVLRQKQTGWEEEQRFQTEELGWRLDKIGRDLVLIAARPTKDLFLLEEARDKPLKGVNAIKEICKQLYTNPNFIQRAVPLGYEIQEGVVSNCHIIDASYLHVIDAFGKTKYVLTRDIPLFYNNMGLLYEAYNGTGYLGVRPMIYLKSNIQLVEGSGTEKDPWKILPP